MFLNRFAQKLNKALKYFDSAIFIASDTDFNSDLFARIKIIDKKQILKLEQINLRNTKTRDALIFNGNFHSSSDLVKILREVHSHSNRFTRIFLVLKNPYYFSLIQYLSRLLNTNCKSNQTTFITKSTLHNITELSGFRILNQAPDSVFPFNLYGLGRIFDCLLLAIPIIRELSPYYLAVLRPVIIETQVPTLSVVVPARDEQDNIFEAINRLPIFPARTELIFIEGHSRDQTWDRIQHLINNPPKKNIEIKAFQQSGIGKYDAVKLGISKATSELVVILDADLTTPPETLIEFYSAYTNGKADFINGNRLLYPQEAKAMQELNFFANIFFAKLISFIFSVPISDSLCGTKLFARTDYQRILDWGKDFAVNDPFGDFELLFAAASINLGIIDVPVHYKARTYGVTKINRFKDGLSLLKICWKGFLAHKSNL